MNHAAGIIPADEASVIDTAPEAKQAEAPPSLTFEDIEREALAAAKGEGTIRLALVTSEEGDMTPLDVEVKRESKNAGAFSLSMRFFLDEQRLPAHAARLLIDAYEVRRR